MLQIHLEVDAGSVALGADFGARRGDALLILSAHLTALAAVRRVTDDIGLASVRQVIVTVTQAHTADRLAGAPDAGPWSCVGIGALLAASICTCATVVRVALEIDA